MGFERDGRSADRQRTHNEMELGGGTDGSFRHRGNRLWANGRAFTTMQEIPFCAMCSTLN